MSSEFHMAAQIAPSVMKLQFLVVKPPMAPVASFGRSPSVRMEIVAMNSHRYPMRIGTIDRMRKPYANRRPYLSRSATIAYGDD